MELLSGGFLWRSFGQVSPGLLSEKPDHEDCVAWGPRLRKQCFCIVVEVRRFTGGCEQCLQSLAVFPAQGRQGVDDRERAFAVRQVSTTLIAPEILDVVYQLLGYTEARTEGCVGFDPGGLFGGQGRSRGRKKGVFLPALVLGHRAAVLDGYVL